MWISKKQNKFHIGMGWNAYSFSAKFAHGVENSTLQKTACCGIIKNAEKIKGGTAFEQISFHLWESIPLYTIADRLYWLFKNSCFAKWDAYPVNWLWLCFLSHCIWGEAWFWCFALVVSRGWFYRNNIRFGGMDGRRYSWLDVCWRNRIIVLERRSVKQYAGK